MIIYSRKAAERRADVVRDRIEEGRTKADELRRDAARETGEAHEVMLAFAEIADDRARHDERIAEAYERIARGEPPFPEPPQ